MRVAAVVAVAGFLVLAGGGAGWAFWSEQTSAQIPAAAADLTVAPTGFESLAKSFTNDSLVHTGSVTVTNTTQSTSSQRAAVTLTLSATGQAPAFLQNFAIVMWASTTANPCTGAAAPGAALISSNWGAASTWTTPAGQGFSAGEARAYCVRTTAASRDAIATANGGASFTPQIAGSITLGSFTGTGSQTVTQGTSQIYPSVATPVGDTTAFWIRSYNTSPTYPLYCVGLSSATPSSSAPVVGSACKTSGATSQLWQFNTLATRPTYLTISSRANSGYLVAGDGGVLRMQLPSTGQQTWQVQQLTSTRGQIVNDATGLCWTVPTGTAENLGQITLSPCTNARTQWFSIDPAVATPSCSYSGLLSGTYSVTIVNASTGSYELRVAGVVSAFGSRSGTQVTFTFPRNTVPNGTSVMDILDNGTRVANGSVTKGLTGLLGNSCSFSDMTL